MVIFASEQVQFLTNLLMKKTTCLLILVVPLLIHSQGNPPPPGLEDPPTVVPIDQIDVFLFLTALCIGFYFICKKHNLFLYRKKKKTKLIKQPNYRL